MSSLRARLFVGLAAIILATGIPAGAIAFRWAFDEAIELQDAILLQVAALAQSNRLRTAPPAGRGVDAETRVVIAELGEATAPAQPASLLPDLPADIPDGLATSSRDGRQWRVLVRTRADGSRVAVGQLTRYRDEIARGSALRAVVPLAVLVPCLMLLVGLVIRTSFRPVSQLAARLDSKESDHLAMLPLDRMPGELRPFVESINRLLDRIGTMFDQQRRFVADAAHELRTPITALSLQAGNLDRADLPPESRERLAALRTGIRRTAHLLEQLLALARYEAGSPGEVSRAAFDHVVSGVVADLLPLAEARSIDLGFVRIESILVRADATALAVLVRNLVDNAIRHTPPDGRVDVDLYRQAGRAILTIEDTGLGIPEADLPRIFEPFFRGSRTAGDGSGLGLSIVRRIVEGLAGSIALQNIVAPDRTGLRVVVEIPAGDAVAPEPTGAWDERRDAAAIVAGRADAGRQTP